MSDFLDLGELNAELEAEYKDKPPVDLKPAVNTGSLEDDLLAEIESEELAEMPMDEIQQKGISSDQQAEYFIRTYKELKQREEDINKTADDSIAAHKEKVDRWREDRIASLKGSEEYIQNLLMAYAQANLTGKKKSLKLIEGTIGFSKQQPVYDRDDDKIRKYLQSKREGEKFLEPVAPKVKWGDLKKAGSLGPDGIFRLNDVAVPGVVVTQRPDKFTVR